MFFFSYLSCICSLVACITQIEGLEEAADVIAEISQIIWCSVRALDALDSDVNGIINLQRPGACMFEMMTNQPSSTPVSPVMMWNQASQLLELGGLSHAICSGSPCSMALIPALACGPQVCACMLTQHKAQLDARDKNPGMVRPAPNPYAVRVLMLEVGIQLIKPAARACSRVA